MYMYVYITCIMYTCTFIVHSVGKLGKFSVVLCMLSDYDSAHCYGCVINDISAKTACGVLVHSLTTATLEGRYM